MYRDSQLGTSFQINKLAPDGKKMAVASTINGNFNGPFCNAPGAAGRKATDVPVVAFLREAVEGLDVIGSTRPSFVMR